MRIEAWVSFSAKGVDGGNEARPAGNMFEVLDVDDTSIVVRNDSCGDYWLRVIASDPVKGCGANGATPGVWGGLVRPRSGRRYGWDARPVCS